MQMNKSKFNVGDVVEVVDMIWPYVKSQIGVRANKKFRVLNIDGGLVKVDNLAINHEEFWLSERGLVLVTTAAPKPIFTPARPTEPNPALTAPYDKTKNDHSKESLASMLARQEKMQQEETNAVDILRAAGLAIGDRAAERDIEAERSMSAAVAAFNALHGTNLTEELGWQFMVLLKMSRAKGGKFRLDDYIDGAAYNALAGEAAAKERK